MSITLKVGSRTFTPGRVFCAARNYAEHARELRNVMPEELTIFMKPVTSLVLPGRAIERPRHGKVLHHEVEVVVLLGKGGSRITEDEAAGFISGITLGLDLTLRDVQSDLKGKGLPWERSKSFDQSAPLGEFVPYEKSIDLKNIEFSCSVNGETRQKGNTGNMTWPIPAFISRLSEWWRLLPGDLIYTGTPSGVGPLNSGDAVTIRSDLTGAFSWKIA